jgi:hypothetical protein
MAITDPPQAPPLPAGIELPEPKPGKGNGSTHDLDELELPPYELPPESEGEGEPEEPLVELPPEEEPALPEPVFTGGTGPTGANLHIVADGEGYVELGGHYLVADVLPCQGVSMIFGPYTAGKTWLVLSWAIHVAAGRPWLGRPVSGGTVLYIAAEGSTAVKGRILAIKQAAGIEHHLPLLIQGIEIVFNDPKTHVVLKAEAIRSEVARRGWTPVCLVVVDTYSACLLGSANDDDVASDFMRQFRTFLRVVTGSAEEPAAGLLIHHPGWSTPERGRGSSALPGGIDTEIRLEPLRTVDRSLKDKAMSLLCKKMRNDMTFDTFQLLLKMTTVTEHDGQPLVNPEGRPFTALVVQPLEVEVEASPTVEEQKRVKRERIRKSILDFLRDNPGASKRGVRGNVVGKGVYVDEELENLAAAGKIALIDAKWHLKE